jgi:hypothetical protein
MFLLIAENLGLKTHLLTISLDVTLQLLTPIHRGLKMCSRFIQVPSPQIAFKFSYKTMYVNGTSQSIWNNKWWQPHSKWINSWWFWAWVEPICKAQIFFCFINQVVNNYNFGPSDGWKPSTGRLGWTAIANSNSINQSEACSTSATSFTDFLFRVIMYTFIILYYHACPILLKG